VVDSLRSKPVRQREIPIEVTHVKPTNRGELVNYDVGLGSADCVGDLIWIKRVRQDRHGTEVVEQFPL
jgi:hypothetical protein